MINRLPNNRFVGIGNTRGNADFDYTSNTSPEVPTATPQIMIYITKFDFNTTVLGVKDIADTKGTFSVYPNPAKSEVYIKSDATINKVHIFNMEGRLVFTQEKSGLKSIDVSILTSGVYILQTEDSKGKISQTKLIKK